MKPSQPSKTQNPGKKFTGGQKLQTSFQQLVHEAMMVNELEGGYGAYKLSFARLGRSGYSFGGNQMDLTESDTGKKVFRDILTRYQQDSKQAEDIKIDDIMRVVTTKPAKWAVEKLIDLTKTQKLFINTALQSDYGINQIDTTYVQEIGEKIRYIDQVVTQRITHPAIKRSLEDNEQARVMLVDYHNQFGVRERGKGPKDSSSLVRFLNGEEVTLTEGKNKKTDKDINPISITIDFNKPVTEEIVRFIETTKYGRQHKKDVTRRQTHIAQLFQQPAKTKAAQSAKTGAVPMTHSQKQIEQPTEKPTPGTNAQTDIKANIQITLIQTIGINEEQVKKITEQLNQHGQRLDVVESHLKNINENIGAMYNDYVRAKAKQVRLDTIQSVNHSLDFLEHLGSTVGIKELSQIAQFTKFAVTIGDQVSEIIKGSFSGSILGPVGIVGGAILGIVNLFMQSGPSPMQIISQQLDHISSQLETLDKKIDGLSIKFNQSIELQRQIFYTIVDGFREARQDMANYHANLINALGSRLDNIQATVDFIGRYLQVSHQQQLAQKFRELQGVLQKTDPTASEVSDALTSLLNWIDVDATDAALTGINLFRSNIPFTQLNQLATQANNYDEVNGLLGYLMHYACSVMGKECKLQLPDAIPNPVVFYRGVDQYIGFAQADHIQHDPDSKNKRIDTVIKRAQTTISFIKNLRKDNAFWDCMLDRYYDYLRAIKEAIAAYSQAYSEQLRNNLNELYLRDSNEAAITNFDLLDHPNALIAQFQSRNINKLANPIILNEQFGRQIAIDSQRILETSGSLIPNIYKAASFLDLIEFTGYQAADVNVSNYQNPIRFDRALYANIFDCDSLLSIRDIAPIVSTRAQMNSYIQRGRIGNLRTIEPVTAYAPFLNATQWMLPIQVTYRIKTNTNYQRQNIAYLPFTGNWDQLAGIHLGFFSNPDGSYAISSPAEGYKYQAHLLNFIYNYWQQPGARSILTNGSSYQQHAGSDDVLTEINKFYLEKRHNIVLALTSQGQVGNLPSKPANFDALLNELNNHVQLINWYLYLTNREAPEDSPFDKLVTGTAIRRALNDYLSPQQLATIDTPLVPTCLTQALEADSRISYQAVEKLEPFAQLPSIHPLVLLTMGKTRLEFFKYYKEIYKKNFPHFSEYIDLQLYLLQMSIESQKLFQIANHLWFKTLQSQKVRTLLHEIEHHQQHFASTFTRDKFEKAHNHFHAWADVESQTDIVIGDMELDVLASDSLELIKSVSQPLKVRLEMLKFGWDWNIKLLMAFAEQYGSCDFSNLMPRNFSYWRDGIFAYLRLILDNNFTAAAKGAGSTSVTQIKAVNELLMAGEELMLIIETMAASEDLFDKLFDIYSALLTEIKGKVDANNPNNLLERLKATASAGTDRSYLDELEVISLLLDTYIQICFEQALELSADSRVIKGKSELINYLNIADVDAENNVLARLIQYEKELETLKEKIEARIAATQKLCKFRQVLLAQRDKTILCIEPGEWGSNLGQNELLLLEQHLAIYKHINGLMLKAVMPEADMLYQFKQLLLANPRLKKLGLTHCELEATHLEQLAEGLFNIKQLDLSHNKLGEIWNQDESISQVERLFEALPNLTTLKVVHNQLNDNAANNLIAAIEYHPSLTKLDMIDNDFSEEVQDAVELFIVLDRSKRLALTQAEQTKSKLLGDTNQQQVAKLSSQAMVLAKSSQLAITTLPSDHILLEPLRLGPKQLTFMLSLLRHVMVGLELKKARELDFEVLPQLKAKQHFTKQQFQYMQQQIRHLFKSDPSSTKPSNPSSTKPVPKTFSATASQQSLFSPQLKKGVHVTETNPQWYGDELITALLNLRIQHELDGFRENHNYLLNDCYNGYLVAVTPAVDTQSSSTSPTYFLDKSTWEDDFLKKFTQLVNNKQWNNMNELQAALDEIGGESRMESVYSELLAREVNLTNYQQARQDFTKLHFTEVNTKLRAFYEKVKATRKYSDVFDELQVFMRSNENYKAKILFPFNRTNTHWLTGEIIIHKSGLDYQISVYAHDPVGGGRMSAENQQLLETTIRRKIAEWHDTPDIKIEFSPSPYKTRQQDDNSCGVITVEDMIKRIRNESPDVNGLYPAQTDVLRQRHLDLVKAYLSPADPIRQRFEAMSESEIQKIASTLTI